MPRSPRFAPLMGRRDRRSKREPIDLTLPVLPQTALPVVRDDSEFRTGDGQAIRSLGYVLLDPTRNLTQVGDDAWLRPIGCRLTKIAGLTHHPQAAQDPRFAPGSVVVLAPMPENPVDPYAVGVWDATGEQQVGFVPAEHAQDVADRIAAGEALGAVILREYRSEAKDGPRIGLVMLIAPAGTVKLRVEGYTEPPPADDDEQG